MIATRTAIFGICLGISTSLMAQQAEGRTKCAVPQGPVDRKACAAAADGPDALRRFVDRTKAVYGLYFWDYVQEGDRFKARRTHVDLQLGRSE